MDTVEKLDLLAEYHSQKDSIESQKRALLDEVKIPVEIEQIVNAGMKMSRDIEEKTRARIAEYNKTIDAEIQALLIPEELRKALDDLREREAVLMSQFAEFEKQRQEIAAQKKDNEAVELEALKADRAKLEEEVKAKTAKVYADIAQRKNEIEVEFSGKAGDVDKNIAALESEIKAETKAKGETIKGKYFMAVYVKGRTSWNNEMLDGMISLVPQLEKARKIGEPSITLRHV